MSEDSVLAQRKKIANWVSYGLRAGTVVFAIAMSLFFLGFMFRFTPALTTAILISLIVGSILLAPAMVFNYGLKAANREDRKAGR
jgi:hypothetical protein